MFYAPMTLVHDFKNKQQERDAPPSLHTRNAFDHIAHTHQWFSCLSSYCLKRSCSP